MNLALLWPDTHIPYEDRRAVDLILEVASFYKKHLKEIILLGDFGDFQTVSSHGKHPVLPTRIIDDVEAVNGRLDQIDKLFPDAKKKFIEGNHEYRFERYLLNKAPELFGITSMQHLLKMNLRPKWSFHDYKPDQAVQVLNTDLWARHEPLGSSPKASVARSVSSVVYGHIHRIEESSLVGMDRREHINFSVGWVGDKTKSEVFGYVKGHHQWQLGFGLVWDMGKGQFHHNKVRIVQDGRRRRCVVGSKLFSICNL